MTAPTATNYATAPLSEVLRHATSIAHEHAEGSMFMTKLLSGDLNANAISSLAGQLWFIYDALENAVRRVSTTPVVAPIMDTRLERRAALENDLSRLIGGGWLDEIRILPATKRYVDRLNSFGEVDAARVIAHHYVRYLGDISGGQVIAARLASFYGIDSEALKFYDFAAIGKIPPYRANYRRQLDQLLLTEEQRVELIEEAKEAFALNTAVFMDLFEVCT
ncbi:Heme oxygenase [Corynebacterium resistens DSM 45100]|mgnify:CR=1 FL=1|uniref:Heme oxygenase n=1 Tax=Corynebacterium resistens (strain DSM 45100 / JCM 12819 / GTC 2026 / SICGH 158) TaxID=662755 RepID=F8E2E6_CORRG|nr:biliverdin-producing heme oxygenase [Corynebacterium resistens]AEI08592.1 Heme oxygenase [Corynebacterium resistens DSM 45100]